MNGEAISTEIFSCCPLYHLFANSATFNLTLIISQVLSDKIRLEGEFYYLKLWMIQYTYDCEVLKL